MKISPAIRRMVRYGAVGGSTFAFDLLLLWIATSIAHIPLFLSTPAAFLIAVSINYFLSRAHVFKGTERAVHHGYAYFIGIALLGAFVTTTLVELLVTYAHIYYLVARILVACVVGCGNYVFNLYVNFKVVGKH